MPKLPEQQRGRELELLDKVGFKTGTLSQVTPAVFKKHLKLPIKPIVGLLFLVVVLGGIYTVTKTYFPNLLKPKTSNQSEAKAFDYPIDVNAIVYPSDFLKQKFLANAKGASEEKDPEKKYKLFEDNYSLLRVFYTQTASNKDRVQLDKFREYIKKNYLKKYEADKELFDYDCIDKLCGEIKLPEEIAGIIKDLQANKAVNGTVRETILRNIDSAGLTSDKNSQGTTYVNVLYSLTAEYGRTKDEGIKNVYTKLADFIAQNYPQITVLEEGKIK